MVMIGIQRMDTSTKANVKTLQQNRKKDTRCVPFSPSDDQQFPLRRLWSKALPYIHGEYRRRRIEDRRERGHQRGDHAREHQTTQSIGYQLDDDQRIGDVRTRRVTSADRSARLRSGTTDFV